MKETGERMKFVEYRQLPYHGEVPIVIQVCIHPDWEELWQVNLSGRRAPLRNNNRPLDKTESKAGLWGEKQWQSPCGARSWAT